MDWLHPTYLSSLAAVPAAVALFLWAAWHRRRALRRFGDPGIVSRLASTVSSRRRRWKAATVAGAVLLLGIALAGPRFGTQLREIKREGVDLVIALDVSRSMLAEDVAPNRLERARNEIKRLLTELQGDRVGLVTFAGDAFIQCPLTTDYSAVRLYLDVADPSLIPTPGTDFGVAFRMAVQAFGNPDDGETRTRALLIVSDGENHIADVDEMVALARREGIVVFAAGVGETAGAPIPIYENGRHVAYQRDSQGNVVHTRLE
jgi:Ca-activated chloride channel homolog